MASKLFQICQHWSIDGRTLAVFKFFAVRRLVEVAKGFCALDSCPEKA